MPGAVYLGKSGGQGLFSAPNFTGCHALRLALENSCRHVKRFRGGLALKAHRFLYHPNLGSRVTKRKKKSVNLRDAELGCGEGRLRVLKSQRSADTPHCIDPKSQSLVLKLESLDFDP